MLALGGLVGALAASSCCILPVLLFSLGISGAWIANFTRLAPYQPIFVVTTVAFLGSGYWLVYRSTRRACVDDQACAHPLPNRIVMVALLAATIIVIVAFALDFVAPYLLS
jgi:mercuric ion transport protein